MATSPFDQASLARADDLAVIVEGISSAYGKLPDALRAALDAYTLINAQTVNLPDVDAVTNSASDALADAAFGGHVDVVKVAAAVEKATADIARADVHRALLAQARVKVARRLGAAAFTAGPALVDLLRAAVLPALDKVADLTAVVPADLDDARAFRAAPPVQSAWNAITAVLDMLAGAVASRVYLRNLNVLPPLAQDLDDVYGYVQNPIDTDDPRAVNGSAEWSTLPTEGRQRILELSRRGARFWFPTSQEQDDAYAAGLEAMKSGIATRQAGPALVRSGNAIMA